MTSIKFNSKLQINETYSSEEYNRTGYKGKEDKKTFYNKSLIIVTKLKNKLMIQELKTHIPGNPYLSANIIKKIQELEILLQDKVLN